MDCKLKRIKITVTPETACGDRRHHVMPAQIRTVLSRLPYHTWRRLREIHLNDTSLGVRRLGYVCRGRREITLCALPRRVSLTRFLAGRDSPRHFGARRGAQWPALAVRRFVLYDVFLHQLGHLQVIRPDAKSDRMKFALDLKAQEFADFWRDRLWAVEFDHHDLVHNAPSTDELVALDAGQAEVWAEMEQAERRGRVIDRVYRQLEGIC
jgi:hypothetical protein